MINKLSSSKATGPGVISVKTTEHAFSGLLSSSYRLFNLSIVKGTFPSWWKVARITTLYKDGAHDSRDNDRPISLLSVLSKVMETCYYILCELSRTQWIAIRSAVSFLWRSLYWVYSNQTDKQNIDQLGPGRSYWNDFCRLWKGILRCQWSTVII